MSGFFIFSLYIRDNKTFELFIFKENYLYLSIFKTLR
jgi:hypothetical protein